MTPSLWTTWPRVCVGLAGGRRLLGLVDRLAHAVAEAGALRDADFLDGSHAADYRTGSAIALLGRRRGDVDAALARRAAASAMRRMISVGRRGPWRPCGPCPGGQLVGQPERRARRGP